MLALFCIFNLGQKFDFKKLSTLLIGSFLIEVTFLSQMITFSRFESSLEVQRAKRKFLDNPGHNILELYSILVQIRFPTSKRKLDIQYSKLGIRVASRIAERLRTQDLRKLGNIRKISTLGGHMAQCLVSIQELRLYQQHLKNTQKHVPNFSFPVQFYWITPFCYKYFLRDCSLMNLINSCVTSTIEYFF